ncbi:MULTISPECIES: DoxX family protein [unclassified Ruegeria]|uniref:DoxX family protein n=1 Tax=unclassified Ruegeria TaxID=2625375 RepID=UPI0014886995|nr:MULTISPECIES: DoxX family protein [unclassified Ruegeria]
MSITLGRCLLAVYFLIPGLMKFAAFDMHVALMQQHNVPAPVPLLVVAGVANIAGALLLLFNRFVRAASFGLVAYILLVNFCLHDFWNFEGVQGQHEVQNFVKNLGILAGTLILAGASPKRPLDLTLLSKSDNAYAA